MDQAPGLAGRVHGRRDGDGVSKTEQIIARHATLGTSDAIVAELRRLAKLNEAYLREVAQWRMRERARQSIGARPFPWPDLEDAIEATDAARREAGEV